MNRILTEDKSFEKIDFTVKPLPKADYEYCTFLNCNFSNADLSEILFLDCEFIGCNLSNADLNKTLLRDINFKDYKMLGLRLDTCNGFGLAFYFENCALNHSSFYKTNLKKIIFRNSHLHEVDFTEADLTSAVFDNCDLQNAHFENTILEKADLRSSFNYSIDPEKNNIKKARFSLREIPGLLGKYDIEIKMD